MFKQRATRGEPVKTVNTPFRSGHRANG